MLFTWVPATSIGAYFGNFYWTCRLMVLGSAWGILTLLLVLIKNKGVSHLRPSPTMSSKGLQMMVISFISPTTRATFTWENGRMGAQCILRLDRTLNNDKGMDLWTCISCTTLPRLRSDHHPILLVCQVSDRLGASPFRFLKPWTIFKT